MLGNETGQCALCRVYEAVIPHNPRWKFSVCVSEGEERKLREEIALGRKLLRLGRVLALRSCENATPLAAN